MGRDACFARCSDGSDDGDVRPDEKPHAIIEVLVRLSFARGASGTCRYVRRDPVDTRPQTTALSDPEQMGSDPRGPPARTVRNILGHCHGRGVMQ